MLGGGGAGVADVLPADGKSRVPEEGQRQAEDGDDQRAVLREHVVRQGLRRRGRPAARGVPAIATAVGGGRPAPPAGQKAERDGPADAGGSHRERGRVPGAVGDAPEGGQGRELHLSLGGWRRWDE